MTGKISNKAHYFVPDSVSTGAMDAHIRKVFEPVFASVGQFAVACDISGRIVAVNSAFAEVYEAHGYQSRPMYLFDIPFVGAPHETMAEMQSAIIEAANGTTGFVGYEGQSSGLPLGYYGWSVAPVRGCGEKVEWLLVQAIGIKDWLVRRVELAENNAILEEEVQSLKRRSTDLEWTIDTLEGQSSELVDIADEGELVRLELAAEIEERKRLEVELVRIAITDPLTGAFNRRRWMEVGSEELARMQNGYKPFSVICFDIGHFKKVNDTWSHKAGDDVLVAFTAVCKNVLGDLAENFFRIGGEEFVCLLQATDLDTSWQLAEDFREAIEQMEVQTCGKTLQVTASLGVTRCKLGESLSNVLSRADQALYQAKAEGRNRVVKI